MFALRRKAAQSAERLPIVRATRRYASGHAGDHGHAVPKDESLGVQFYVVLAALPLSIGVYALAKPGQDGKLGGFSRLIESWANVKERTAARNTLHTSMIEQAAFDRNLFHQNKPSVHVNLRFPEVFNGGSPHNVSAGQGARNLEHLVAHYTNLNAEAEENKAKKLSAQQD